MDIATAHTGRQGPTLRAASVGECRSMAYCNCTATATATRVVHRCTPWYQMNILSAATLTTVYSVIRHDTRGNDAHTMIWCVVSVKTRALPASNQGTSCVPVWQHVGLPLGVGRLACRPQRHKLRPQRKSAACTNPFAHRASSSASGGSVGL
jgi:hypothetical protein